MNPHEAAQHLRENPQYMGIALNIVKDKNNADDAINDAAVSLLEYMPARLPDGHAKKYCTVAVQTACYKILEKRKTDSEIGPDPVELSSPENILVEKERITEILTMFPPEQMLALIHTARGESYKKIARLMGVTPRQAERYRWKAIKKAREVLAG